jgi:hypothetical protein
MTAGSAGTFAIADGSARWNDVVMVGYSFGA